MGAMPSPITGHAGNVEFLLHARTPLPPTVPLADRLDGPASDAAVDEAHDRTGGTR